MLINAAALSPFGRDETILFIYLNGWCEKLRQIMYRVLWFGDLRTESREEGLPRAGSALPAGLLFHTLANVTSGTALGSHAAACSVHAELPGLKSCSPPRTLSDEREQKSYS